MATETATTLKSRNTAIAIKAQSAVGTFNDPGTDYLPVANLSLSIATVETANNEYTGSIEGNAPDLDQGSVTLTFTAMLRGPGGSDVPAANAFILGRLLTACKMSETRVTTAITEALSSGSTSGFTGGVGMTGTADLYRGLAVHLPAAGALPRGVLGIRSNTSAKVVRLARLLSSSPTGNYSIMKQVAYQSTLSSTDPFPLSVKAWLAGKRYDLVDLAVSSAQIPVPTTTRDQGENPTITVTLTGRLHASADEASPAVPAAGTIPKFRDGQQYLADTYIAGSGFTLEMGAQSEAAPDPNKADGSGAQELVALNRRLEVRAQSYLKADFDALALAVGQTRQPFYAQWGKVSGQMVAVTVADARFPFNSPDIGGNIATETHNLVIDALEKNVSIAFPYF
jgi:hypothetical protein